MMSVVILTHGLPGFDARHPSRLQTFADAPRSTGSDSELESSEESTATDRAFTNPLVSGKSVYVADREGQPCES